ncbi:MAG: hypothetical protein IM564_00725 [Chitinophagaceae bacterium]|nr:hypothetical protein [Chitinophagaceae bacterium]
MGKIRKEEERYDEVAQLKGIGYGTTCREGSVEKRNWQSRSRYRKIKDLH